MEGSAARAATAAPEISWVDLAYLPKNWPRELEASRCRIPAFASPASAKPAGLDGQQSQCSCALPASAWRACLRKPAAPTQWEDASRFDPPPQGFAQKGYQAVLWSAEDANDDDLIYAVYYRGEGEKDWKLLKDKLDQKFYSWDTTSMPDGAYYLKIVASDERVQSAGRNAQGGAR